jgi:formate hydrogenlyase subunit 4
VHVDSGIPFEFVSNQKWDVKLYGAYRKVIPLFASRIQPDLVQAYQDSTKLTSKILPFKIGYNVMFNETNLQLFYKK